MQAWLIVAALALLAGAASLIAVTHLAGVGRLHRHRFLGLRSRAALASEERWRRAHRAATPIAWLTGAIGAIAAGGALAFAATPDAQTEALVLVVFSAVVLGVGLALSAQRAGAAVR
ncbi:SdpI family protein [Agrococcus sp. 1P02AA]|uniref:SdpI family protein n=1 Tax=Agrococcus sp. 1P02AA TaxID=3132259 RepID=UPI0039A6B68B